MDPLYNPAHSKSSRMTMAAGRVYSAMVKMRLALDELASAREALEGMAEEPADAIFDDPRG